MSKGFFDELLPEPKRDDYALVEGGGLQPIEEEGLGNYKFNTDLHTWVCEDCGALVASTHLHTSWHERLDNHLARE